MNHMIEEAGGCAPAIMVPALAQETKKEALPNSRQVWRHTSSGRRYVVICVTSTPDGDHERTFPVQVVYRCLDTADTWARSIGHFLLTFEFEGDFGDQYRDNCWLSVRKDLFDDHDFRSMKKAHELFNNIWAMAQEF